MLPIAAWYLTRRKREDDEDDDAFGSILDMTGKDWLIAFGLGFVGFVVVALIPMLLVVWYR